MTRDLSPTARALLTLELLQATPGISADRLSERLGVSERAVRRYIGILREAGIPVTSERGPYGGYRVGRGLRLPPLVFSSTEALGLVMAVLDGHHDANNPADPVGSALGKIVRALPGPVAAQAEAVRRGTAPAGRPRGRPPRPRHDDDARRACSERRVARVGYRSEAGSEWVVDIDPWAVVVRHGRWYVLCRSHSADAVRVYRVDRVQSVELLDRCFTPPADLDPVACLEEHLAIGWEYDTEVVFCAPLTRMARCVPRSLGRLEAAGEHECRLTGSTSNPHWYAAQLADLPAAYRIVGGPELRQAARDVGERMLAAVTADVPDTPCSCVLTWETRRCRGPGPAAAGVLTPLLYGRSEVGPSPRRRASRWACPRR